MRLIVTAIIQFSSRCIVPFAFAQLLSGAPIKARALLVGSDAVGTIDIATEFSFIHIAACVDAFRGRPYPHTIEACP